MSIKLAASSLEHLPASVAVPNYGRSDLTPGIVHFGVGNFHRAHQAVYLDALFNLGKDRDWGLIGAGVRPADAQMRDVLASQDFLTTVVEQEADGTTARVTGPMIDYIAPGDTGRLIETLASPETRIVSMTITEGGYFLDAEGHFNPTHPEIVADAAAPEAPRTVFGLIVAGLVARRQKGRAPFTVMSCDNIPGNGHVTENAVAGLAELIDPALAQWIRKNVAFPNSMVDRITPATSDREREILERDFGVADGWPVFCEKFTQWVMEDDFPLGRPGLEKVGVTFVDDVAPWELMKLRILNGGHAAIAYPAALMDIHFVHEAMEEPLIAAYLEKLTKEEIIPVVPPVPNTDLDAYRALIASRFANPKIGDTIQRLCLDGSNRQPKFILPSANDRLAVGAPVTGLALVAAFWCRYCYGVTDSGKPIAPNDPSWDRIQAAAIKAKDDPAAFLAMDDIFGAAARNPAYVDAFSRALGTIWAAGAREALARYLNDKL
ncbi:mannitol dehydrogenase family protein [Pelagibacterium xiamenense]|uniref:mannitol dehydrogenase family protein n=1 Tax=Pelagibacterium xiamenense TaxID=2901140 RepID=UPI001E29F6AE|nr:mannitol dehydrogenase family protein [Pelagibacterium xiamenense]MCD7058792.1 mannitol dehydrogenase family protein [Pelagibacterium xiamenense]